MTRPVRRRRTVRVLLVDPDERILLLHDSDPGLAGASWWFLPGGGIDPGETERAAVVREIAEETGLVLRDTEVLGPLARRHVRHGYSDQIVEQDDAFYAARVAPFVIDPAGRTEEEQVTLLGSRWWTRIDVAGADDLVWPANLLDIWDLLADPSRWPVPLPTVEESSVPI